MAEARNLQVMAVYQQLGNSMKTMAPLLRGYYVVLEEQGFTPEQAFTLTRDFHAGFLGLIRGEESTGGADGL